MAKKNEWNEWSLALLRVVLGIIFLYHGYVKLFVPGGFKATAGFMAIIFGVSPAAGAWLALLVSAIEFVGGALLILGLLTRWASVVLFIEMLVALFKVHLKQGFFIMPPAYGYEFVLLILASLVVVAASGAGKWSVGSKFKNRQLQ